MPWVLLSVAIISEIIGTVALKATDGLSRPGFAVVSVSAYLVSFALLALVLKSVPLGVAYAIWSGVGVASVAALGFVVFGQQLDWAAVIGISMIVGGVVVLNLFSDTLTL